MLNINIICIGKLKESYLRDGCAEYLKRLSAFANVNVTELAEYKLSQTPSAAEIQKGLEKEGAAIEEKLKGYKIALCIEGKQITSEELSTKIGDISLNTSEISFIIGGSFGLSEKIKNSADMKLSMSKMTFPHQLARVMLLEQTYRAFQILSNGKYHK